MGTSWISRKGGILEKGGGGVWTSLPTKNGIKRCKIANLYSSKSLLLIEHSQWNKDWKPAKNNQIWFVVILKMFYKTTTCPRQPLLSCLKSSCLIQVWLYLIWSFWSFFHFIHSNVSDNKCHMQKWCVLFFAHI